MSKQIRIENIRRKSGNRGYYDRGFVADNKYQIALAIGQVAIIGPSDERGVKTIPEWVYDDITGRNKTEPSQILIRAMRDGVIKIVGDSATVKSLIGDEKTTDADADIEQSDADKG